MADKIITLKIDVTEIEKDRLYEGKKGTYLDAVLFYSEEKGKYNNNGMIVQSVDKEEREDGVQGNILGNAKTVGGSSGSDSPPVQDVEVEEGDMPF